MDISIINRKIFDELSEAEKSRFLRFLSEEDTFKLSNTVSRYVETNPTFVKSFFNELIKSKDSDALYIALLIINDFFDETTKILGQSLLYDSLLINSHKGSRNNSIIVNIFTHNYDKFSEELKEKFLIKICSENITLSNLTYNLSRNLEQENPIYYKFPEKMRNFVLLKTVEVSTLLLSALYENINDNIREKALDILISTNMIGLRTKYLIEFIANNFSKIPENKKDFFLEKILEVAKKEESEINSTDLFNKIGNLYGHIPYDKFLELMRIFINKKMRIDYSDYYFNNIIDKIPEEMRNQLLINQVRDITINNYNLATLFSSLSDQNFNNSIKYLLENKVKIEFFIYIISENLKRIETNLRTKILDQIFESGKGYYIYRDIIRNLSYLPDTIDFLIKSIVLHEDIIEWNDYEIIKNFNSYPEDFKQKFIKNFDTFSKKIQAKLRENPKIKELVSSEFDLLSENGINFFINLIKSPYTPSSVISFFVSNYDKFPEDVRVDIVQELLSLNTSKKYISHIIFKNFYLLNQEILNKLLGNLINSENKKVTYYLAKILNEFYDKISIEMNEKILNKVIKSTEHLGIFIPLIEEKLLKNPDEIIKTLYNAKLSRNIIKSISKRLFSKFNLLPEQTINYLLDLSNNKRDSHYLIWDFISNFNNISEKYRHNFLNNFVKSTNSGTIETLLLAIFEFGIKPYSENEVILKILENKNSLQSFAIVLLRNYLKFDPNIRETIFKDAYSDSNNFEFLLSFLLNNTGISQELINEVLKNTTTVLSSSHKIDNYINLEKQAKKIKNNFIKIPENIRNEVIKLLFNNPYSRRASTHIIINNSKKLSQKINSFLIQIIKENNEIIEELHQKIPIQIKEKIIKNIILKEKSIVVIEGINRENNSKSIKNDILYCEKKYNKPFQPITLDMIYQQLLISYSKRENLEQKAFKHSINNFTGISGVDLSFTNIKTYIKTSNSKGLELLFLSAIFSDKYHKLIVDEIESEKYLSENIKVLTLKVFPNLKSINIIATKLRLDFFKFDENLRNELLILLMDYNFTDYILFFIIEAIKYNIDTVPRNITLKVIKKLNHYDEYDYSWSKRIADDLNKLLK